MSTSYVLDFFNNLFDSFNAKEIDGNNKFRNLVTDDNQHHLIWDTSIPNLKSMEYVDKGTLEPVANVPTLENWIVTINSVKRIWERVKKLGFTSLALKSRSY